MRFLVLLVSLALLAAGPALYMTKGREAREQRIAALEALDRHRQDMQVEADRGPSPSIEAIEALRKSLELRKTQRNSLSTRLLTYRSSTPPSEDDLRAIAKNIALDEPLIEPLLRPMPQGDVGVMRRHVIRSILRGLERAMPESGRLVTDFKVAREPTPLEFDPAFLVLRVDLTLRGDATRLSRVWDGLLEIHPDEPISDLVAAKLSVPDPRELLGVGLDSSEGGDRLRDGAATSDSTAATKSPPLTLVLALDYVVAEAP